MLDYAIIIMIVGAFASLVGGWIKGPNWPRTVLIGLFLKIGEHTSELQSLIDLVCRLLLEKKKTKHHL